MKSTAIKQAVIAAAVASAFPLVASAAVGVNFDKEGTSGANNVLIGQLSWGNGNAVLDNGVSGTDVAITTGARLLSQTVLSGALATDLSTGVNVVSAVWRYSYQLDLPVVTAPGTTDKLIVSNTTATGYAGYWRMFATKIATGPALSLTGGTGFGYDGGAAIADQVIILEGAVRIRNGSFNLSQDPTVIRTLGFNNGQDTATYAFTGGTDLDVVLSSVNAAWFPNADIVKGTVLDIDLTMDSVGLTAAFVNSVAVSDSVVGVTPDFGVATMGGVNNPGGAPNPVPGPIPLNDVRATLATGTACPGPNDAMGDPTVLTVCDGQFQTSSNTNFVHETVPEPGILATLGLGLGLLGYFGRRRRQA